MIYELQQHTHTHMHSVAVRVKDGGSLKKELLSVLI